MASRLNPYLNFNGTARQALEFYRGVFGGTLTLSTFAEFGAQNTTDANRIMHGQLETDACYTIMAADVTSEMEYHPVAGFSVSLSGDESARGERWTWSLRGGRCMRTRRSRWDSWTGSSSRAWR